MTLPVIDLRIRRRACRLDIRARFELLELVHTLGVTTLAVLHDLDLAVRSRDRLVVLDRGRVVASGPVLEALSPAVLSGARPLAKAA